MKNNSISFIIPILNSEQYLKNCLKSIRKQNYPQHLVEIITPDGGSKDRSTEIAKKYNAKVIKNKKILAEPGFMLGASVAKGSLLVYMGADNELVGKEWIKEMLVPFRDKDIVAAYPNLKNKTKNSWLTKYFNAFTDPVNHFILGYANNPIYFHKIYKKIKIGNNFHVYEFNLQNYPMLAFDQGFMVRNTYKRPLNTEFDDILPVLDMIKKKMNLAYVYTASNYHSTLDKGVSQFIKKMSWAIDNNLNGKNNYGFKTREKYNNNFRKLKKIIWPFYAASLFLPVLFSVYGLLVDRKKEWIYHPFITYLMFGLVFKEVMRIKFFRKSTLSLRQ